MADFPCLPLWTDAYLADTKHLTTEQHGAYLLLLMEAWRTTGSLPDDDGKLAKIAGLSAAKWRSAKPVVMGFWHRDGRRKSWTQKRLQNEREKAAIKKEKARDSAVSRWNKTKSDHASAMQTQCSPEPTPSSKDKSFSGRVSAQKKSAELKIMEGATGG